MSLDNIPSGVAAPEIIVNANFVALDPGKLFGIHASATAGLTLGLYGGNLMVGTTPTLLADTTTALSASATNYVESTTAGVVSANTSAFTAGRIQIGIAVTGASTITSWTDKRTSGVGGAGSGGGGGFTSPTGTGFAHVTSGALDAAAAAVNLSGADATGTLAAARMPALTGDVTTSAGAVATTIAADAVTNSKAANMANATIKGRTTAGTGDPEDLTAAQAAAILGQNVKPTESIIIAASDESTALTTGTGKMTFRMPYAFTLTDIRASLTTAQTSGSIFTVDVNESGTTIISTKLTIDNTEKTSTTAAAAPVISDASLADDAEMTIDIDSLGDGTAKGLKICLIGHR